MAFAPGYDDSDEWELVNDDGFVHKRKKRLRLDPAATSSAAAQQLPDPAVERRYYRERKKRALEKRRDKCLTEISRWELLSNTLKETERNATQSLQRQELYATVPLGETSSSEQHSESDSARQKVVDDLLSQVAMQEAMIQNASNLCDVAEALCSAQEDRLKQQLTDLPIWEASPQELMAGCIR